MPPRQSTDKTLGRARQAARAGDWITAQALYQTILDRFPGNRPARQGLEALRPAALPDLLKAAQAAQSAGRWAEAARGLATAAALAPDLPEVGLALAACELEMGRAPAALRAAETVLERAPEHPGALNVKGRALREMGRVAEAEASLQAALGLAGAEARTLDNLGLLARARGDRAAAEGYFRRAVAQAPENAALHRNLAHAITYTEAEPHLAQMRACLARIGAGDPGAAPLHFALFKALDDLDRRDEAFAHLEAGNRLTRAALGYDFQTDAVPYAVSKALFQAPLPAPERTEGGAGPRPIFVTGLPRTGTTLTERILSRAEGVQPCGELTVVQVAVGRLLREVMARETKALSETDLGALGDEIRAGLAEYSGGRPVLVDKMPLNFRWIGYICAALPEARIVHLNRDPVAVAWSLWRHSFAGAGNGFAYDPADIARFMVLHRDLMAHWRGVCPGRIFDLDYAELVADPEGATRALAAAAGLDWTEDWLAPERGTGAVLTASSDQVRRPIYRGSDEGWRRYEAQLAPLSSALSAAGLI
ncbi:tetratricopeptide repeat-containing sulfotransferase family protein [Antarcticimicrobium luteum]|uniref:Sulfotransferase family protein n=1 Tax=Antarcticimicrobium luteum TaxID=2547397 RepID=A0A4V3ASH3_9RHOB|nr:sulfotransferase [Antarcticimicrobium luteum]TDK50465.1 sulfotransferase family protein [Antarcticimicrobium luteum]